MNINYGTIKALKSFKANNKPGLKIYRRIHDKRYFIKGFGRFFQYEKEEYLPTKVDVGQLKLIVGTELQLLLNIVQGQIETDPYREFIPSLKLVDVVKRNMLRPDEEKFDFLKAYKIQNHLEVNQNLINFITNEVEGLFTNLAKRMFRSNDIIKISKNNRFTYEICGEIMSRLGIDPFSNPRDVLILLHEELLEFLSLSRRERDWGFIEKDGTEIKLTLKKKPFKFLDLDKIDDSHWMET